MNTNVVNAPDLGRVPEVAWVELCAGAVEMCLRRRRDPEYRERFERWLAGGAAGGNARQQRQSDTVPALPHF